MSEYPELRVAHDDCGDEARIWFDDQERLNIHILDWGLADNSIHVVVELDDDHLDQLEALVKLEKQRRLLP